MKSLYVTPDLHHLEAYVWKPSFDLYNNDASFAAFESLAKKLKLTIIGNKMHHFSPFGLTVIFLLAESHMGIHTWPEHGFFHIDFLTCGKELEPKKVSDMLNTLFSPEKIDVKAVDH